MFSSLRKQWPELLEAARVLPTLLTRSVQRAQHGNLRLQIEAPEIESLKAALRASNRRRDAITIGAVILLGGMFWLIASRAPGVAGLGRSRWRWLAIALAALDGVGRRSAASLRASHATSLPH